MTTFYSFASKLPKILRRASVIFADGTYFGRP